MKKFTKRAVDAAKTAKQMVKKTCSDAREAVDAMSLDDKALASLALGIGSWGLLTGVGTHGFLGASALGSGVGAVVMGFKGKETEKETLRKSAIAGTILGTFSIVSWAVCRRYDY